MLTKREKRFFAETAWGASRLSVCEQQKGAVLINRRQIQSYGFNKKILKDKHWEISAIYDAIFGTRNIDMSEFIIFSTHSPSLNDMILIVSVGIISIYHFGDLTDVETIKFLKGMDKTISLEIINLK